MPIFEQVAKWFDEQDISFDLLDDPDGPVELEFKDSGTIVSKWDTDVLPAQPVTWPDEAIAVLWWSQRFRQDEVDLKTPKLILEGFTHNGEIFSLSHSAQANWNALYTAKDLITFPYEISTKDSKAYNVQDITELTTFFLAAIDVVNGHISSGRALKVQMQAATKQGDLDAIADGR